MSRRPEHQPEYLLVGGPFSGKRMRFNAGGSRPTVLLRTMWDAPTTEAIGGATVSSGEIHEYRFHPVSVVGAGLTLSGEVMIYGPDADGMSTEQINAAALGFLISNLLARGDKQGG